MIGLMILAVVFGYIFLSKFIVTKVLKEHGMKKANIALAIMILIPTWDVILGFPIYGYLCLFESGTKIYKTVDNVEGFYVGEKRMEHEPHEPYNGYKYVEYEETKHYKATGKYYRSYWVDNNTSKDCIPVRQKYGQYAKAFKSGKCIVKKEISESEVSRWEYDYDRKLIYEIPVFKFRVYRRVEYLDRQTKEIMASVNGVWWQVGWVWGFFSSIESGSGGISYGTNLDYEKLNKEVFKQKGEK